MFEVRCYFGGASYQAKPSSIILAFHDTVKTNEDETDSISRPESLV
jgi:hypothetical protein